MPHKFKACINWSFPTFYRIGAKCSSLLMGGWICWPSYIFLYISKRIYSFLYVTCKQSTMIVTTFVSGWQPSEQNWSKAENMNRWLGELQSRVTDAWNSQLSVNINFSPEHLRSIWIQLKRHSRAELNLTFELNTIDIPMMSVECSIKRSSLHPHQRVNRP